jgi:hypothetical protein
MASRGGVGTVQARRRNGKQQACEPVSIPFLCLDPFRFLDFAAMFFPSYVSSSSFPNLRTKTHTNLL